MADVTINNLSPITPTTGLFLPASDSSTTGRVTLSQVCGVMTSAQITTALGYTPYNSSNPAGYITSTSLPASQQLARAWVCFDGTGIVSTNQTIRSAYNVTNVLKNAIGDYTIYFTAGTFTDTNYCIICSTSTPNQNLMNNISDNNGSGIAREIFQSGGVAQRSSSSCRVGNYTYNDTYKYNPQAFSVMVYR